MEINTQQIEALLHLQEQQAQLNRKNGAEGQGFEVLLNQQLSGMEQAGADPALAATSAMYNPIMTDNSQPVSNPDAELMLAAFDQASGALDMWDAYAATLGASRDASALKDAYSLLDGIDAAVAGLRANPAADNDNIGGIINELEILAATERFKFNRGDYLA